MDFCLCSRPPWARTPKARTRRGVWYGMGPLGSIRAKVRPRPRPECSARRLRSGTSPNALHAEAQQRSVHNVGGAMGQARWPRSCRRYVRPRRYWTQTTANPPEPITRIGSGKKKW